MSTTFSVTRDDIINRALRICGAYDATHPPSSTDFSVLSLPMNILIKAWLGEWRGIRGGSRRRRAGCWLLSGRRCDATD